MAPQLRARLWIALGLTGLPACSEDADPGPDAQAGADAARPLDAGPLPPPLVCPPDDDPMALSGPCCDALACYRPADGAACLVDDDYAIAAALGHTSPGSGECLCGTSGPYDPVASGGQVGDCCYVITIQWCTGRPLVVAGVARVAPLTRRADWC
ncbi:MAG: hypothetical protein KC549_04840 [Myxococcales bacterium]|nr:hypothetical protein [Myxococcales bacterium]MCB9547228.1 hypothetical protein [Myxococcales bacterium]